MDDSNVNASRPKDPLSDPKVREEFKNNPAAQFKYGRQTQHATEHFDQSSRRLDKGNPDVGEIDLGNIESDRPAEPDDNDHFD